MRRGHVRRVRPVHRPEGELPGGGRRGRAQTPQACGEGVPLRVRGRLPRQRDDVHPPRLRRSARRARHLDRQHALQRGVQARVPGGLLHLGLRRAARPHDPLLQEGGLAVEARLPQPPAGGRRRPVRVPALLDQPRLRLPLHLLGGAGSRPDPGPGDARAVRPDGRHGDVRGALQGQGGQGEAAPRPGELPTGAAARARSPPAPRDVDALQHRCERVPADLLGRAGAVLGGSTGLGDCGVDLRGDHSVCDLHGAKPNAHSWHMRPPGEVPSVAVPLHLKANHCPAGSLD
mmetsp:Transcript_29920/g.85751  ORF Transcript_29920/g.85751 Transcript_29920/m.85751 type:complete len:289 (-) Transcript_29920:1202-2068(-)